MTTLIFVLIGIILILGFVLFLVLKSKKELKKENARLNNLLYIARKNVEQITTYLEKQHNIKIDDQAISEKIKGAKSDEEIIDILSDIINNNNSRL